MEEYYIYEWIRLDLNEPFYIGKGKGNRCYDTRRNKHFKDVIRYCLNNNIQVAVSILLRNLSEKEAYQYECWYINMYFMDFGFNLTNKAWGGEGGNVVSLMSKGKKAEYSRKMRQSCLGKNKGKVHSKETKKKISDANKGRYIGEMNPMYGKNIRDYMSEENYNKWRENISNTRKGKVLTKETKIKLSNALKGKRRTFELKEHLRKINEGKGNPMYGRRHSDISKEKIALGNEKKLIVQFKDGNKMYFDSRNKCAKYFRENYNISIYTIKRLLKTNEILNSKYKKFKELNGLKIFYITDI